jgi:hypothetical protein
MNAVQVTLQQWKKKMKREEFAISCQSNCGIVELSHHHQIPEDHYLNRVIIVDLTC